MSSIGVNLDKPSYWGNEEPFLDRFKTAGAWYANDASSNRVSGAVPLDANGNPTGVPAGAKDLATQIGLDTLSAPGSDRYVITYSGTATIAISGGKIISSQAGKIVFELTDGTTNFVTMTLKGGINASDPIHDIHVVREDQVALFNTGEIFNPDFVAKVSQWSVLRFKDWENTDKSPDVSWDKRSTLATASWAPDTSAGGVPIEVQVALANKAHVDMWVSIPTKADDTYVRNMLTYIRDHLDPSLHVKVEYSNEVWNWGYPASQYAQTKGNELWGKDVNGDGVIDASNAKENFSAAWVTYYGYRSAQVAAIANSVFGQSSQLETVLSTQTAYTGLETYILDGVRKANVGSVSGLFDDYAVTTYFGDSIGMAASNSADHATVLAWARSGDAGVTAALKELETGGSLSQNDSLAALLTTLSYQAAVAKNNGLKLVAYEGGANLTPEAFPTGEKAEVSAFIGRLLNDPRIGPLYTKMAQIFQSVGGTVLAAFKDVGANGAYGYAGLLDDIYQKSSPRYDALLAFQKNPNLVPLIPVIDMSVVSTSAASYNMKSVESTLIFTGTGSFNGTGNALDNKITGGSGNDTLRGGDGNDALYGGDGNDFLDGGTGADKLYGGAGNDTYIVDNAGDQVIEEASSGNDSVQTTLASYTLTANVEGLIYTGSGTFAGTGNALDNMLRGGSGASTLWGLDGNDTLYGGTGLNTLYGGRGDDTYYVSGTNDRVVENAGEGNDLVFSGVSYALGANVEALRLTGTASIDGSGNASDNDLRGNSGDNRLYGYDGNDVISGLDGNDTLDGGAGNDLLFGGSGNDTLLGGDGNDGLDGGIGADLMSGGFGDDSYTVDNLADRVVELAGQGNDRVTASVNFTLPDNVETLYLADGATIGGGNALDNVLQANTAASVNLLGMDGNDRLIGNAGNDRLYGGNGNDTLLGGGGNDVLYGGAGTDQLTGGLGADQFAFRTGELATTASAQDTINDFSAAEGDKIDLSAFDAKAGDPRIDPFSFIGSANFSHKAGELRTVSYGNNWYQVQGDTNGDGVADVFLLVNAKSGALTSRDFLFAAG